MQDAADQELTVFVSYSRSDTRFTDELASGLELLGINVLIDRVAISEGEDWKARLESLIAAGDTVVFILSPASVASKICAWEVDTAISLSKRIVPVLVEPLGDALVPPPLAALNYVRFDPEEDGRERSFVTGLKALAMALRTDLGWIREHTRLLARAQEWEAAGQVESRMLQGADIAAAKAWATNRPKDAPLPTSIHLAYIQASERAEDERKSQERARLDEIASAQKERAEALEVQQAAVEKLSRRTTLGLAGAGGLTAVSAGLAYWGVDAEARFRREQARVERAKWLAEEERIKAEAAREDIVGSLTVFPVAPGEVLVDSEGDSEMSPFSDALLRACSRPDRSVEEAVREAREGVARLNIRPYIVTDLSGEIYFSRAHQTRRQQAVIVAADKYDAMPSLQTPVRDGRAWAQFLEASGFDVHFLVNKSKADILEVLKGLEAVGGQPAPNDDASYDQPVIPVGIGKPNAARNANTLIFFYFAGYGVLSGGRSYIVPSDASMDGADQVMATSIALDDELRELRSSFAASVFVYDTMFFGVDEASAAPG